MGARRICKSGLEPRTSSLSGCLSEKSHLLPMQVGGLWTCPRMTATVPNRPLDRAHDGYGPLISFRASRRRVRGRVLRAHDPRTDRRVRGPRLERRTCMGWKEAGDAWGARATDWAFYQEPLCANSYDAVHQALEVANGFRLLDVACGSGLALSERTPAGPRWPALMPPRTCCGSPPNGARTLSCMRVTWHTCRLTTRASTW